MNIMDYFVLGVVAIAVIGIVFSMVRRKGQCKSGCGCCPYKNDCKDNTTDKL